MGWRQGSWPLVALFVALGAGGCGDEGGEGTPGDNNAANNAAENSANASTNNATNNVANNANNAASCDFGACSAMGGVCGAAGCVEPLAEMCSLGMAPGSADAALIGVLVPLGGFQTQTGELLERAILTAAEEIEASVGLGLGLIVCDSSRFPLDTAEALEHLLGEIGVDLLIGPDTGRSVLEVAEEYAIPAGVPVISATAREGTLTELEDGGLVWRTIARSDVEGTALGRRALDLGLGGGLKVAVVADDSELSAGQLARLMVALEGVPASELHVRTFGDQVGGAERAAIVTEARDALGGRIDAVIILASGEIASFIESFEAQGEGATRYLAPSAAESPGVLRLVEGTPGLIGRVEVVTVGVGTSEVYEPFAVRWDALYDELPSVPAANAYDAMWIGALVLEARRGGAADVPAAFGLLQGGARVRLGPEGANQAFTQVRAGVAIDVEGPSGPLDFDLGTGDVAAPLRLRVLRDIAGRAVFVDEARYDADLDGEGVWR